MNITTLTISLATAVANGVALSQTPVGAIAITLNGSLVSGGVATFDVPRRVAITSASNASNSTYTITGTDRYGNTQVATLVGPNATTVFTSQDFATVTNITQTATPGGAITIGTNGVASTPWYVGDWRHCAYIGIKVELSPGAVLTYTVESTGTDLSGSLLYPNVAAVITNAQNPFVFPSSDATVVAANTSQITNFISAEPGMRLTLNSYTSGTATIRFQPTNVKTT